METYYLYTFKQQFDWVIQFNYVTFCNWVIQFQMKHIPHNTVQVYFLLVQVTSSMGIIVCRYGFRTCFCYDTGCIVGYVLNVTGPFIFV